MKQFILLLLITFLASTISYASDDDRDGDRETLKLILVDIQNALNSMDMDALLYHMDEEVTISFMTTEVVVGRGQIESYYNKMFIGKDAPLKSHKTEANVEGPAIFRGNTAIAYGRTDDTFVLKQGEIYNFDTRWVATAVKESENWKVVSIDFSVNPFSNVILEETKKHLFLYAILAFISGIVITVVILKISKSK